MAPHPLYEKVILQHSKHPCNFGSVSNPTIEVENENPVCGDRISLQVVLRGNQISDIKFRGNGCAISQASASLMTERVKGETLEEAGNLLALFKRMVLESDSSGRDELGKLMAFEQVRKFSIRKKCAVLAWDALGLCLGR